VVGVRASPGRHSDQHPLQTRHHVDADDLRAMIFQSAELRAPLADLSPWPDWLVLPLDEVLRGLRGNGIGGSSRRTRPLDGLPLDRRVRYIVAARRPLDAAVSMYHQAENLNRRRLRQLIGESQPAGQARPRPPLRDWLLSWIDGQADLRQHLDSLPWVFAPPDRRLAAARRGPGTAGALRRPLHRPGRADARSRSLARDRRLRACMAGAGGRRRIQLHARQR
jgi:hypothetical protein